MIKSTQDSKMNTLKIQIHELGLYMQFAATQKHQTRERTSHSPVLFLHPCWELNLGALDHEDAPQPFI
jgi:hypothetical protein